MTGKGMFDEQVLETFIKTFYGYGNYHGDYWFIGMEESGGDFEDISNRLNTWSSRGQIELEDVAEYHETLGVKNLFQESARIQPTWNKLIRILLSIEGLDITRESVRSYQVNSLARRTKNTCLLELLPLPSPSTSDWFYNKHSRLTYLTDRSTYTNYCAEWRTTHIRNRIQQYKPKAVVFYGFKYEHWWRRIAEVSFSVTPDTPNKDKAYMGSNTKTIFAIVKHPRCIKNEFCHHLGKLIASQIGET